MSGVPAFKLVEAGFSQPQVEALAEAARRSDLLDVEHRLDTRIADVERRLDTRFADVEHRIDTKINEVKSDIAGVKIDMIKWMFGLLLAQTGLFIAGVKLVMH